MERLAIDILGPLIQSKQGNKYILIAAGYFIKWVEAYPLVNQEAVTVAEVLIREFISRFGVPLSLILHFDQGRNFESAVFSEMCKLLRVAKTRTTLLNPQSDGMVEHFNRTLEAQLSRITNKTGISRDLSHGCYSCCHSWRLHIQMATNIIIICKTMIPSTPVGMLSGGMKIMRSIGGKHQHLALILIQLS